MLAQTSNVTIRSAAFYALLLALQPRMCFNIFYSAPMESMLGPNERHVKAGTFGHIQRLQCGHEAGSK